MKKFFNNLYVKVLYGIGIAFWFIFYIVYLAVATLGFKLWLFALVLYPFNYWPEIETVKDLSGVFRFYAELLSVYVLFFPKLWEDKKTHEPISFFEYVGTGISKMSSDLEDWYNEKIIR